ncbi:MAG: glycosyltransferase family 61 protein [Verrucomicrobiia bacterium]
MHSFVADNGGWFFGPKIVSVEVLPWESINHQVPINFDPNDERLFEKDFFACVSPAAVHEVHGCLAWTHPIIDHAGRRFLPVSRWIPRPFDLCGPFSWMRWLGEKRRHHGFEEAALVYDGWSKNNIYHWICDTLPRLLMIEGIQGNALPLLLPDSPPTIAAYQQATLEWLRYQGEIYRIPPDQPVRCRKLYVADATAPSGQQRPSLIQTVRSRLSKAIPLRSDLPERIYISREKASVRRVQNESSLRSVLESAGFETLYLEDLPPQRQAEHFKAASFIVAAHGGGMANLIYCRPGTPVLEIRNGRVVDFNCYFALANNLGLSFHYFKAEPIDASRGNLSDLSVDVTKLERLIETLVS